MEAHLKNLLDKHLKLDKEIRHGEHASSSSDLHIHELKKQKLRLKEEIERLKLYTEPVTKPNYLKDNPIKAR